MKTRAVRDGDDYVLTGTKYWITNAGISDTYTVFAKTDPDAGHRGISCFLVEADWGVQVPKLEHKMGLRASPTGEVLLDEVRVPVENRIGEEGQGFYIAMHTLDRSRPTIGAQAVGIAQGALDYAARLRAAARAVRQADRRVPGPAVHAGRHGDAQSRRPGASSTGRARSSTPDDPSGELAKIGAMAKCFASDVGHAGDDGRRPAARRLRLLRRTSRSERFMRDAKITQIYEGTNQVQRVVISKRLLK